MQEKIDRKYDDIINLNRPVSKNHPPMSMHQRAAQFAPFAALVGHKDAIDDTAKLAEEMVNAELEKIEVDGI